MSTSRLSSLLVRDGVVAVKKMEMAFQRQVIYGGSLDTMLLEMNAIPEDRLVQYLALSSGLPAAEDDLVEVIDPRGAQVCPREMAEEFQVAPVSFEGQALRVLVIDPVDLSKLEELATRLKAPIQPFVVPEYRFHLVLERLFGIPTPSRYAALAAKRQKAARTAAASSPPVPPVPGAKTTRPISTQAITEELERRERERKEATAAQGGSPVPVDVTATMPPPVTMPALSRDVPGVTDEPKIVISAEASEPIPIPIPIAPTPTPVSSTGVVRSPWRGGDTIDPKPLSPKEAVELLIKASDRDVIFGTLLRAARGRAHYAALLIVQGGAAFGRVAIDGDEADALKVAQVALPLDKASAVKTAVESRSPYVGSVQSGVADIDDALQKLGGYLPPNAVIIPVVLRERVVALVYAHRREKNIPASEVATLFPVAVAASHALERLILKAKSEGYKKPEAQSAPIPVPIDEVPTKKDGGPAASKGNGGDGSWAQAARGAIAQPIEIDGGMAGAHSEDAARILDELEKSDEASAPWLVDKAVKSADILLAAMERRFPGRLWIDRYHGLGRPVTASQHGPLLMLAVKLGTKATELLLDRMSSDDREIRYYATLVCAEVRAYAAIPGLVARLFDPDYAVRAAALDALIGYPPRELDEALEPVRRALRAEPAKARAAAHALGQLRDVRGIADLIEALDRDATTAEEARRSLVELTKQDFGTKSKKWATWWEKNRDRPRIEWMLDGLAHTEDAVRLSASEELRRLTGEYFGYHYDLPKREREEARMRWMKWWEETGRRRFVGEAPRRAP
jgi:HEAT repeat protein